jgi:hypothetical protein
VADPILKNYNVQALQQFERAGRTLAARQDRGSSGPGQGQGNVPPWPGSTDPDFHGTLAAIWIWARHQNLSGDTRFAGHREAAWVFVAAVWRMFVPEAIGPHASDEAAYDCALVLRAVLGEAELGTVDAERAQLAASAARVLAAYLGDLDDLSGRDFHDPGFLAWNASSSGRSA